jgi:hypothetical protein
MEIKIMSHYLLPQLKNQKTHQIKLLLNFRSTYKLNLNSFIDISAPYFKNNHY